MYSFVASALYIFVCSPILTDNTAQVNKLINFLDVFLESCFLLFILNDMTSVFRMEAILLRSFRNTARLLLCILFSVQEG